MQKADIRVGQHQVASVSVTGFGAQVGLGGVEIYFSLECQTAAGLQEGVAAITIVGPVFVRSLLFTSPGGGGGNTQTLFLDRALQPVALPLTSWNSGKGFHLQASLTLTQVAHIERIRSHKDLQIQLLFDVYGDFGTGIDKTNARLSHDIAASAWVNALNNAGYRPTMMLELPMAGPEDGPMAAQVDAALREAEAHFQRGSWGACGSACRKVITLLTKSEMLGVGGAVIKAKPSQNARTAAEQLAVVGENLHVLCSKGVHEGEDTGNAGPWTRADAEFVLMTVAALVRRVRTVAVA